MADNNINNPLDSARHCKPFSGAELPATMNSMEWMLALIDDSDTRKAGQSPFLPA